MKKFILLFLILALQVFAFEPKFMYDPSVSPDGKTICFKFENDLWLVPWEGGEAKRLTNTDGEEVSPIFSPDGKNIAFASNKNGYWGMYVVPAEGGKAKLISKDCSTPIAWFPNEDYILSELSEFRLGGKFYKVPLDGSRAIDMNIIGESFADMTSDGKKLVFCRNGYHNRERYTGTMNGELYEYDMEKDEYTKLTDTDLTERYPVYSKDDKGIYFVFSDGENFQLFYAENGDMSKKVQLTDFDDVSVRDISVSKGTDRVVFERFDELWKYDPETKEVEKLDIEIKEDMFTDFIVNETVYGDVEDYAVSPDGKLVAFTSRYDLFAVPQKGGEVKRLTFDQPEIKDIEIAPDNKTIFFTQLDKGSKTLYKLNILNPEEKEKIDFFDDNYIENLYIVDGRLGVSYSDGEEKFRFAMSDSSYSDFDVIVDNAPVLDTVVADIGSDCVIYAETSTDIFSRSFYYYNLKTKEKKYLFSVDEWPSGGVFLGTDKKTLFFSGNSKIQRVDLRAKDDFYGEKDYWEEILKEEEKKEDKEESDGEEKEEKKEVKDEKPQLKIDYDGINRRLSSIIRRNGHNELVHVANDSTIYYVNSDGSNKILRKTDYDGKNDNEVKVLSKTASTFKYDNKNDELYFIEYGKIKHMKLSGGAPKTIGTKFKYDYNVFELNKKVFEETWKEFGKNFYDKDMHGIDWEEQYKKYSKYTDYLYSTAALQTLCDEMVGDVNGSHAEFWTRNDSKVNVFGVASIGGELDFTKRLDKGIKINKVYRESKLNKPWGIKKGAVLLSVDGVEITEDTQIHELFENKVGEKIELEILNEDTIANVEIKGVSRRLNWNLKYNEWVAERKDKVNEATDGKIGYVHIQSMNNRSYKRFIHELFAENYDKDALIIDVRYNGGGYIHDDLLEVLTKKPYSYNTRRWVGSNEKKKGPGNVWDKPVVVLMNEHSMSDAEIFPYIFKEAKLGKVIGVQTSGYVIGTWNHTLMDGSTQRLPVNGWFKIDGENMEGNGARPDITVDMTLKELLEDNDVQLKVAIEELLKELK